MIFHHIFYILSVEVIREKLCVRVEVIKEKRCVFVEVIKGKDVCVLKF